jgi:hypothetical protein
MKDTLFLFILFLLVTLFAAVPLKAAPTDEVMTAISVEDYRSIGDQRTWRFVSKDTTFGFLISTVTEAITIDNKPGVRIEGILEIDYSKIGGEGSISQRRDHYVTSQGQYLGDRIILKVDDQSETFELERKGESVSGFFTRAGNEVSLSHDVGSHLSAWDNNYIDQLEMYLVMRGIRVGDQIVDSIFQPQAMVNAQIAGTVYEYSYEELYRNHFDSVFLIRLSEPVEADLYYTADRRLVKVDMVNLDIRIYQDVVQQTATLRPPRQPESSFSTVRLLAMSPHYAVFLLFTVISLLMFMGSGYKWSVAYMGFLVGGLLFFVTLVTQIPLQKTIVSRWLIPAMTRGESLYVLALLPSLVTGVIQELLKFAALFIIVMWRCPKSYRYSVIGAFCGAGLAFVEACYQTGTTISPLFSLILVERGLFVLFHVAAGALIGRAMALGTVPVARTIVLLIGLNAAFRYLPTFVQQQDARVGLVHLVFAIMVSSFLCFVLFRLRRMKPPVR